MAESTSTSTPTSPIDTLNLLYKGLYDELALAGKQVKSIQENLKSLNKEFRTLYKQTRTKEKRPQTPLSLSKDLSKFLSVEQGTKLTKSEVMKSISSYIKEKNLQVAENKRQFVPNKQLAKIFNMKNPTSMTFVEINKHVSHHLTK